MVLILNEVLSRDLIEILSLEQSHCDSQWENFLCLRKGVPRPYSCYRRELGERRDEMGSVELGHGMANFKLGLACIDEPNANCSTFPLRLLRLLGASHPKLLSELWSFLSRSDTPTCDRYNACISCHDPLRGPSGGGVASTTQGGIDAPVWRGGGEGEGQKKLRNTFPS